MCNIAYHSFRISTLWMWVGLSLGASLLGACSPLSDVDNPVGDQTSNEPQIGSEKASELTLPALPFSRSITTITRLKDQPEAGETFAVEGRVQQRVPILNGWIYQVQDETGQIWILTQENTPVLGDDVRVTGVLQYEKILVGETDIGEYYLQEERFDIVRSSDQ